LLIIIDFTKIEDLTLNNTLSTCPLIFDYVPIPVTLAVFVSFVAFQKHDGGIITERTEEKKGVGIHYKRFWRFLDIFKKLSPLFTNIYIFENSKIFLNQGRIAKIGLGQASTTTSNTGSACAFACRLHADRWAKLCLERMRQNQKMNK